ncbi:MAG TPA: sterol desaturase family protein [Gammaproteobacteria bacterium]|nr:sterol desaturase family protein [Gammaproteobacteria bacterium]HRP86086.1 sterol desaturase family protein [Gammaproteobacteria bacterium]
MPTPWEILLDPLSLTIIGLFAGLATWEALAPRRVLPAMPGWRLRGLAAFAVFFFLSSYLPMLWDDHLAAWQLFDLSGLGVAGGALAGMLVSQLLGYWWHRALHRSDTLWLGLHQMHHSAERLDAWSAYWFSPLDMVGWTAVGSLALVLVVGVDPRAATLVLLLTSFLDIFTHANVRTPRWLGYLVARPEMHAVHHTRGVHRYNFASLPVLDMLFGTYRNPRTWDHQTGFYDGASRRVGAMLLFRDVSQPEGPPREPAEA